MSTRDASTSKASTTGPDRTLCHNCLRIPFDRFFERWDGVKRAWIVASFTEVLANAATCTFCLFLDQCFRLAYENDPKPGADLTVMLIKQKSTLDRGELDWIKEVGIQSDLPTAPGAWITFNCPPLMVKSSTFRRIYVDCGGIAGTPFRTHGWGVRRLRLEEVVSGLLPCHIVREWLNRCQKIHQATNEEATAFKFQVAQLRLIDVDARQVKKIQHLTKYVALSYRWGPHLRKQVLAFWSSAPARGNTLQLPRDLPQTIQDAMTLTRMLGLRYLWVDAYCIDQGDDQHLDEQIGNMHLVYSCAYLTIAAMDGENAHAGLAGVTRRLERLRQPIVNITGRDLMATYTYDMTERHGPSEWETRGWTLQENLLSARVLFLHRQLVAMKCHEEFYTSLMDFDTLDSHSSRKPPSFHDVGGYLINGSGIKLRNTVFDFEGYTFLVNRYSCRYLTDQNDILRAITGALNEISASSGVGFWHGLPRAQLHHALLWEPCLLSPVTRRPGFPSWSWAGWEGEVLYHKCISRFRQYASHLPSKVTSMLKDHHHTVTGSDWPPLGQDRMAYIVNSSDSTGFLLRLSTTAATATARKIRDSIECENNDFQVKGARLIYRSWRQDDSHQFCLLDASGRPFPKHFVNGEIYNGAFKPVDFSFRLGTSTSKHLLAKGGSCELVFISSFEALRDEPYGDAARAAEPQWLVHQVACLVCVRDENDPDNGPWERIAMVWLDESTWLSLNPQLKVVEIA